MYNKSKKGVIMKYLVEIIDKLKFESTEIEFKLKLEKDQEKVEKWLKTLAAFSNSDGGIMYVGVNNDGLAVGITKKEVDEYKNLIYKVINRYLFPHINPFFELYECEKDKYVLEIKIDPSEELIVYKVGDFNEKVYIRCDGASLPASVKQILQLGKRTFGVDREVLDRVYQKTDFTLFNNLGRKYRKDSLEPTLDILISKEVVKEDGRITEGLRMFSDKYESDDTLISCRIWNGNNKGIDEMLDKKEFKGSLCHTFTETMNFIRRNSRTGFIKMKDGSRLDTLSYPEQSLREAIVNAIAHRDYSIEGIQIDVDAFKNRLEISSPGAWILSKEPNEYEMTNIPSIRRNKIICNCFECVGLMEKIGSGFKKIYKEYEKFEDKKPLLEDHQDFFTITLFDMLYEDGENEVFFGKYDKAILEYCKDQARTREEIQNHIGYSSRSHFRTDVLNPLIEKGLIIQTCPPKSKNQKYISKRN